MPARFLPCLVTAVLAAGVRGSGAHAEVCGPYAIAAPTLVAFFDTTGVTEGTDEAEALADFTLYLGEIRERFEGAPLVIELCEGDRFAVTVEGKRARFRAGRVKVGYYLVRPGKKPHVVHGVHTDDDLEEVLRGFFTAADLDRP